MEKYKKLGGIGASDIGKLFTKDGIKSKTTQSLALKKAKELYYNDFVDSFTTNAMQHGLASEHIAYESLILPNFPNAVLQPYESIWINERSWASPDVVDNVEGMVMDIKCPFSINTYFDNIRFLKKDYILQMQKQMMCTKYNKGYLVFYLTSCNVDEYGNIKEYSIDINKRHKFIKIDADKDTHKEILRLEDEFFVVRDIILDIIRSSVKLTEEEIFDLVENGKKITLYDKKSNLLTWKDKIYECNKEFYILE